MARLMLCLELDSKNQWETSNAIGDGFFCVLDGRKDGMDCRLYFMGHSLISSIARKSLSFMVCRGKM